jgi:hypothetical protein
MTGPRKRAGVASLATNPITLWYRDVLALSLSCLPSQCYADAWRFMIWVEMECKHEPLLLSGGTLQDAGGKDKARGLCCEIEHGASGRGQTCRAAAAVSQQHVLPDRGSVTDKPAPSHMNRASPDLGNNSDYFLLSIFLYYLQCRHMKKHGPKNMPISIKKTKSVWIFFLGLVSDVVPCDCSRDHQ